MDVLFDLPLWAVALVLNLAFIGIGLSSLYVFRRFVLPRWRIQQGDAEFAGSMTQSIMVFYGLIAALIAVSVWQRYSQVADLVSNEAAAIASLWRDIGGYPQERRETLRADLRGYTEYVIREAWPLQKQGKVPGGGSAFVDRLLTDLFSFEPAGETQKIVHAETLKAFNAMHQARRLRLDAVNTGLPGVLWLVIIPGGIVSLLGTLFFRVEDARLHAVLLTILAGFVAMVIFVIVALDRPFRGDLAIPSTSYELVRDQLMKR